MPLVDYGFDELWKLTLYTLYIYHFERNCKWNVDSFPESMPNGMQKIGNTQDDGKSWG